MYTVCIKFSITRSKINFSIGESLRSETLQTFLDHQISKINNLFLGNDIVTQNVEVDLPRSGLEDESNGESIKHFTFKSNQVAWESNKKSYMHLIIDTSSTVKLQAQKTKNKVQKVMFASVSHELRTPLNAFENSLSLIEIWVDKVRSMSQSTHDVRISPDKAFESIAKYIKMGKVSSKILMNIVEDILDLEKIDSGTFSLNIDRFRLSDIVDDINFMFKSQCNEKHLDFNIIVPESIKRNSYTTDQGRIKQVLTNLLSNSMKFTPEGGITVTVSEEVIHFDRYLKFIVHDTGIGISKSDQNNSLFKMFGMIKKHQKKFNQHGTGIGLVISKKIVESLDGYITVRSVEREFTEFIFTIKLQQELVGSQIDFVNESVADTDEDQDLDVRLDMVSRPTVVKPN